MSDKGEKSVQSMVEYMQVAQAFFSDPAYADKRGEGMTAVRSIVDRGELVTPESIKLEMGITDPVSVETEDFPNSADGTEEASSDTEKVETKEYKALFEHVEKNRAEIQKVHNLFFVVKDQILAHIHSFTEISDLSDSDRLVEFAMFSPEKNSAMADFFAAVKKLDLGLGKTSQMAALIKHVYPQKNNGKGLDKPLGHPDASAEFIELYDISAHDLNGYVSALTYHDVLYSSYVEEAKKADLQRPGSGDLEKVRSRWNTMSQAFEAGMLLQEDMHTRVLSKDSVRNEDLNSVSLGFVLDVLEDGVTGEKDKINRKFKKEEDKIIVEISVTEEARNVEVKINEGVLYHILRNIAYNPIRKTYVGADKIDISVQVEDDGKKHIILTIADNGYGIDPDMKDSLFDPRATGASSSLEGKGLGLAYADKRLESMGATIDVVTDRLEKRKDDKTKYGTTITIKIPV